MKRIFDNIIAVLGGMAIAVFLMIGTALLSLQFLGFVFYAPLWQLWAAFLGCLTLTGYLIAYENGWIDFGV